MGSEEYIVDYILRARVDQVKRKKVWSYFVKWRGYDKNEDNTWEPAASFSDGSEHFIEKFWTKITSHNREGISRYSVGEEVFPTGPPRKKPTKLTTTTKTLPKKAEPSAVETVEDSEGEVQSLIDDDSGGGSQKRRASSPIELAGQSAAKRTRRQSSRAAASAASDTPKQPTRQRSTRNLTSSASKSKASANAPSSSRKAATTHRKPPEPTSRSPLYSSARSRKPPATSRFAPAGTPPVADEPSAANDAASDLDNVLNLVEDTVDSSTHGSLFEGDSEKELDLTNELPQFGTSDDTNDVPSTIRDSSLTNNRRPRVLAHRARAANPRIQRIPIQPSNSSNGISVKARIAASESNDSRRPSSSTSANGNSTAEPSESAVITPAGLISSTPQKFSLSFPTADTLRTVKGSIMGMFSSSSQAAASGNDVHRMYAETGDTDMTNHSSTNPSESLPHGDELLQLAGADPEEAAALPDYDEDAEGELDDELKSPSGIDMNVDLAEGEKPKDVRIKPTLSATWRTNTIFGPLGLGRDLPATGSPDITQLRSTCPLKLSYSVTLPLTLKDIYPPNSDGLKPLNETVLGSNSEFPGKFYKDQFALALTDTFRAGGSCARGVLDEDVTPEQKDHFQRFSTRLLHGELFVIMIGSVVLAFCSSTNNAIGSKLGMSRALIGLEENVLVTEVVVANDGAYCDAAANADDDQW